MPYATTNPPICTTPRIGSGPAGFVYSSADAHTSVDAAGYFSNGADLGLAAGDYMTVIDTNAKTCTVHHVLNTTTISVATLA